jgi:hypothetical protein
VLHQDARSDFRQYSISLGSSEMSYNHATFLDGPVKPLRDRVFGSTTTAPFTKKVSPPGQVSVGFSLFGLHWTVSYTFACLDFFPYCLCSFASSRFFIALTCSNIPLPSYRRRASRFPRRPCKRVQAFGSSRPLFPHGLRPLFDVDFNSRPVVPGAPLDLTPHNEC